MEDLKEALNQHVDLVADLVDRLSGELRSGFRPAVDNFVGFFQAIDWTEPWLVGLLVFHLIFLLTTLLTRKNVNFQLFLSFLTFAGVYGSEKINSLLERNWKSFASRNYFDRHGVFISVLWSGPLLFTTIIIVVNVLFSLCYIIVKWKKAELRHRARLAREKKQE